MIRATKPHGKHCHDEFAVTITGSRRICVATGPRLLCRNRLCCHQLNFPLSPREIAMRARIALISLPMLVVLVGCPANSPPPAAPAPTKAIPPAAPSKTATSEASSTTQTTEPTAVPDDPQVIEMLRKLGAKVTVDED